MHRLRHNAVTSAPDIDRLADGGQAVGVGVWMSRLPRMSRLPGHLALWLAGMAAWAAIGLFFASQIVILGPDSWRHAMQLAMPRWITWGLLAPGIARVDRWLGAGRPIAARLAMHLPLGLAWNGVALTIRLLSRQLVGNPWPPSIIEFVLQRIYWDLLIYAVIAGVSVARDYAAQVREHERETHRLALEAAELKGHLVEARLHSLRSQLQPHFLFNALNTISALTETDPKTARRLMDQLGQLLRASLRHATTPLVTLAEELTFLDDYLAIELVRFEGRISVSVRADDDALEARVPSFLLQPLVENAIRHGVGPRLSGGHIGVTATRERKGSSTGDDGSSGSNGRNGDGSESDGWILRLRVCDNGVGLSSDWTLRRDAGVGVRNAAARLEQLYPRRHTFRIAPASSGGVEALIDLPWQ
jgi:two-component system LytT family sensor kinase